MLQALLARPGVRAAALALFGLYVFVLGAAAISASTVEAEIGVTTWSDGHLVPGGTSGLRVAVLDPRSNRYVRGFEAQAWLETLDGTRRDPLFDTATPWAALSWTLRVPGDFPAGPAHLVVTVRRGDLTDTCRADVTVGSPPAPPGAVAAKPRQPPRETRRVYVEARGTAGVLVPELSQRLMLRARLESGAPAPGETLTLKLVRGAMGGLPAEVVTDGAGLASVTVEPHFHDIGLQIGAAGAPPRDLTLKGSPGQFVVHAGPLLRPPGLPLEVTVDSIHGSGTVHADLFEQGRWVASQASPLQNGKTTLRLPAPGPGVAHVQVLRHFAAPGKARYALPLLVAKDDLAAVRRLASVSQVPAAMVDAAPDRELLAAWMLAQWPHRAPEPPLLAETGSGNKASIRAWKNKTRRRLVGALAVTGALVLASIVYVLVFHVLHLERRYAAIREEEDFAHIRRSRAWWEAALLLATITVAIIGLLVMLDGLQWGPPL